MTINIEVVYATAEKQAVIPLTAPKGCTAIEAVNLSNIISEFSELNSQDLKLGVYGRVVAGDYLLNQGDRVEIYRPLLLDPKQSRRERAKLAKEKN